MPERHRQDPPLLGVMIDRSSFDNDSLDDDSITLGGRTTGRKRKDGLIRRKLRWKPAAFRSRNTKAKPASDATSVSDRSNRSTMSFHTFHSTETPVQSNAKSGPKKTISRPNYSDTFDGVMTIDNEGQYVHTRMLPKKKRAQSPQALQAIGRVPSLDFHSISEDSANLNPYQELKEPHIFDPFGQYLGSKMQRPPKWTKKGTKQSTPFVRLPLGKPLAVSPQTISTARTVSSEITEEEREWPITPQRAIDFDRQTSIASFPNLPIPWSGADAAAGLGLSPVKSWSPGPTPMPLTPVRDYGKAIPRNPNLSPMIRRPIALPNTVSPDPVLAKVTIDLNSPSSLSTMLGYSALVTDQDYLYDKPGTHSPHKPYNRPVDTSISMNSIKSMSPLSLGSHRNRQLISDDDSLSTRSPNVSMDDLVLTKDPCDVGSKSQSLVQASTKRRPRAKTGPVDIDNGAFVEAESHLNAIYEMAAEHLAHGEFVEALEVFEEILRGQRERYGERHFRVGTALHNIGIVHLKSGNYTRAVEVCELAVRVRKETLGRNHPDIAVSLAQLGVANLESRQYRQALIAFREALQIRRDCLGHKHPKVGKILNNVGCALYELVELDGARLAFEEALEIQRESLRSSPNMGGNDEESRAISHSILLSIASTLCNIGSIKLRWGLYEEASVALEEALLIQQSVLGDDHQIVLATIKSIDFVDEAMENGDVSSYRSSDFFARWNPTGFSPPTVTADEMKGIAMGCASLDHDSSTNTMLGMGFLQSFRWDKSKRWYKKVEELLPSQGTGCGPSFDEAFDDKVSTNSRSFPASPAQFERSRSHMAVI